MLVHSAWRLSQSSMYIGVRVTPCSNGSWLGWTFRWSLKNFDNCTNQSSWIFVSKHKYMAISFYLLEVWRAKLLEGGSLGSFFVTLYPKWKTFNLTTRIEHSQKNLFKFRSYTLLKMISFLKLLTHCCNIRMSSGNLLGWSGAGYEGLARAKEVNPSRRRRRHHNRLRVRVVTRRQQRSTEERPSVTRRRVWRRKKLRAARRPHESHPL